MVGGSDGLRKIPPPRTGARLRLPRYLGVLGVPGLTGYAGVTQIIKPGPGSNVFVSSAAGAVGLVAGQVAKQLGARVVGSTGSDAKVAFLLSHGFDAAFNYKKCPGYQAGHGYSATLAAHFPDGIDGYFDCVGGAMLDAVLGVLDWGLISPHAVLLMRFSTRRPCHGGVMRSPHAVLHTPPLPRRGDVLCVVAPGSPCADWCL